MYTDVRQPILQDLLERPGVRRRGGKMRAGGADPARARAVRPYRDARLDQTISGEFRRDHVYSRRSDRKWTRVPAR